MPAFASSFVGIFLLVPTDESWWSFLCDWFTFTTSKTTAAIFNPLQNNINFLRRV